MHTSEQLNLADFEFWVNEEPSTFDYIFPNFQVQDRIGLIVRHSGGGFGASAILMASITKFYDFYRNRLGNQQGGLRIYPDFFIFHVGFRDSEYYWMDIWPSHKEVHVEDEPEQILGAINDRAITHLIVPDGPTTKVKALYSVLKQGSLDLDMATFLQETVSSAEERIKTCLIYSPDGRTENSDIKVKSTSAAESNVFKSIRDSKDLHEDMRKELFQQRESLLIEGSPMETYRHATLSEVIPMLSTNTKVSKALQSMLDDLTRS